MKDRLRSRRELAIVAAALLLPVPLLTASGLMVPLPDAVERALVSLTPGGDFETRSSSKRTGGAGTGDSAGNEQTSAGALIEGGSAPSPASGNGAAGSNGSSANDVLPRDERIAPGGSETDLPAAPASPRADETGTETGGGSGGGGTSPGPGGGGASPAPDTGDQDVSAVISAGTGGITVDTSGAAAGTAGSAGVDVDVTDDGVVLSVDADKDDDTSGNATVTVPLPQLPLP